jgi:histone H3/H4
MSTQAVPAVEQQKKKVAKRKSATLVPFIKRVAKEGVHADVRLTTSVKQNLNDLLVDIHARVCDDALHHGRTDKRVVVKQRDFETASGMLFDAETQARIGKRFKLANANLEASKPRVKTAAA